jgi:aspartate racemase
MSVQMKKIGIVGGVAWLSTIEYYRAICQLSQRHFQDQQYKGSPPMPEMSIESVNMNHSFGLRGVADDEGSWSRYDAYFNAALKRLEVSGANFAIIASNTPHNRYDAITRGINIPVLNIFDVVAKECVRLGVEKILILGTEPTMNSSVFPRVLAAHDIAGAAPGNVHDKSVVIELIGQLQAGNGDGAAERMHAVVESAFAHEPEVRKVACLACTELPLAFADFVDSPTFEVNGVLYVNTTIVHARAAFEFALF